MGDKARWFGMLGAIDRRSAWQVPLGTGAVGPMTITKSVYGLVPGRDGAPYWATRLEGEVAAASWSDPETLEAARQARLLASLLSLSYEPGLQLLSRPGPDAEEVYSRFEERTPQYVPGLTSGVPSDLHDAWDTLESNDLLQGPLLMFHEGIMLRSEHPSMALVAFVAAIEAVGQLHDPPDLPCPACGFKKGAHRAFKNALKQAGFNGTMLKSVDTAYGHYRSPTVHSAVLHGHEITSGVRAVRLDASVTHSSAAAFTFPLASEGSGQLWLLEQACKKVLLGQL